LILNPFIPANLLPHNPDNICYLQSPCPEQLFRHFGPFVSFVLLELFYPPLGPEVEFEVFEAFEAFEVEFVEEVSTSS